MLLLTSSGSKVVTLNTSALFTALSQRQSVQLNSSLFQKRSRLLDAGGSARPLGGDAEGGRGLPARALRSQASGLTPTVLALKLQQAPHGPLVTEGFWTISASPQVSRFAQLLGSGR